MGKIRTRIVGDIEAEKKQKEEQKERAKGKKSKKKAASTPVKTAKIEKTSVKVSRAKKEPEKEEVSKKPTVKRTEKIAKPTISVRKRGRKYKEAKKLIDKTKTYSLGQALELLKKMKIAGFDESLELHINVDQTGLRGEVQLPHAIGKQVRIAVVDDKVLEAIGSGKFDFDILITHPSFMPKLARFAKVLGPKGLMPNPKAGTISPQPEEVAKKIQKGALRWKTEAKFPLIHQMVGKISYPEKDLAQNATLFIQSVGKAHIRSVYMKTTMSPSVRVDVEKI